jgi:hypothetical protein
MLRRQGYRVRLRIAAQARVYHYRQRIASVIGNTSGISSGCVISYPLGFFATTQQGQKAPSDYDLTFRELVFLVLPAHVSGRQDTRKLDAARTACRDEQFGVIDRLDLTRIRTFSNSAGTRSLFGVALPPPPLTPDGTTLRFNRRESSAFTVL